MGKLLVKAHQSLAAARALLEQNFPDFAVSRAYYAMLYAAQAALLRRGERFKRHSAVVSRFGRDFVKAGIFKQELHEWFRRAFLRRQVSDYEAGEPIPFTEAELSLARAEEFVRPLESWVTGQPPDHRSESS